MSNTSEHMKRFTGVSRRAGSAVWQWAIKAPADLRQHYKSQWAFRCSLDTTDLRQANERASALYAQWQARFAEQRRSLNPTKLEAVSTELATTLAARVRTAVLGRDDVVRGHQAGAFLMSALGRALTGKPARYLSESPGLAPGLLPDSERPAYVGLTAAQATALADTNAWIDGAAARGLAAGNGAIVLPLVEREARALGFAFDPEAPGARNALALCLRAYRAAWKDVTRRDAGDIVETPQSATFPRPLPAAHKPTAQLVFMRDLLPKWKADKARKLQTEQAAEKALSLYEEATNNPPMASLTRSQGSEFKAWLLSRGTTAKTARDRFDYVKAFLNFAARDLELIPRNPWEGLSIEYTTTTPRRPWSTEQLQKLTALPLFTSYAIPRGWQSGQDAAYWLPLLGIFTGARISELAQLRVIDVETVDGVAVLRITNEAEGASIKTEAGRRAVPVHRELERLGFLEYVAAIRAARAVPLWPALRLAKGKAGSYFSQWFSTLRKVDEQTSLPDFHSLRHTVRSKLSSAGVAEPTIDVLIGHEVKGSTGARTYTERTTEFLKRELDRLSYPGLDLPRVFSAPTWTPED